MLLQYFAFMLCHVGSCAVSSVLFRSVFSYYVVLSCAMLCCAVHCTSCTINTVLVPLRTLCVVPFVYVRVCLRGKNMKVNPILTLLLVNYSGLL